MADFNLVVKDEGATARLVLFGELDLHSSPRLRQELVALVSQGVTQVSIDLEAVEFIDSTALGVLVGGLKRLRELGGDLLLTSPSHRTRTVLRMTGLDRIFTVVPMVE